MSPFNSSKKWSAKSVLLWFFISLLLQFIVYYFAFIYGGSVKALGYISFAGTMVSIILAVLAIGYTHVESNQQKSSSITLANQIDELVGIKESLKVQADSLKDIQLLKVDLKKYSEKVEDHFIKTNDKLGVFTEQLNTFPQVSGESGVTHNDQKITDKALVFQKIFVKRDFLLNAVSLILFVLSFESKEHYSKSPFSLDFLDSLEDFKVSGHERGVIYGFCFHLTITLLRLELANKDTYSIDPIVIEKFNLLVNKGYDELKGEFDGAFESVLERAKKSEFFVPEQ